MTLAAPPANGAARRAPLLVGLASALLLASGPGAPRAARGAEKQITSNAGTWHGVYECRPPESPLNETFGLSVRVYADAAHTRPAADVELSVDARMPRHGHGMRREPMIERAGPGHFEVEGMLLHMPGYWELHFDVTRGAVTERAQDSLELD